MNKEKINTKNILKIFLILTLFVLMNVTQAVYAQESADDETDEVTAEEAQADTLTPEEFDQVKNLISAKGEKAEFAKIFVSKYRNGKKYLYIQLHDAGGEVIGHIHAHNKSGEFKEVPIGLMPTNGLWKSHIRLNKGKGKYVDTFSYGHKEGADTTYKKSHFKIPNSQVKESDYNSLKNKTDLAKERIAAHNADHTKVLVTKNLVGDEAHTHIGHYDKNDKLVGETHLEVTGTTSPIYHKNVLNNLENYGGGKKVNTADLGITDEIAAELREIAKIGTDAQIERAKNVRENLVDELQGNPTERRKLENVVLLTSADEKQEIKDFGQERDWKILKYKKDASGNYNVVYEDPKTRGLVEAILPRGSKDIKIKKKLESKQHILPQTQPKTFVDRKMLTEKRKETAEKSAKRQEEREEQARLRKEKEAKEAEIDMAKAKAAVKMREARRAKKAAEKRKKAYEKSMRKAEAAKAKENATNNTKKENKQKGMFSKLFS